MLHRYPRWDRRLRRRERAEYELLSGDALIVAVMHAHGLTRLASHDADFDRVSWLTRYAPV
ncbi:MAG: PIN domain-containing protein [Planctomycetota bacterium]|nr:PIN domain-containing protein [Planctomycetota bacterium]